MYRKRIISGEERQRALDMRDLTDPSQGLHAIQQLVARIERRLVDAWGSLVILHRGPREVTIADNYDRLGYSAGAAARDARYSRYVSDERLLRTHMSAVVPGLLRSLSRYPPRDAILVCPGIVYRRDSIDRLHTGEPHQLDVWRLAKGRSRVGDLRQMVELIVESTLPGATWRTIRSEHPYTTDGLQIDVERGGRWVEIGECGLIHARVLGLAGIDPELYSGLAMGIGLDRLLTLVKKADDIRTLRSSDPRIACQMLDLSPYRPVSNQPAICRDLSVAVSEESSPEEIGDRVRAALGEEANRLEVVEIVSETGYEELPEAARTRLGMSPDQKNVLLRLVIRHLTRTQTSEEANELRDRVYRAIHEGRLEDWALP